MRGHLIRSTALACAAVAAACAGTEGDVLRSLPDARALDDAPAGGDAANDASNGDAAPPRPMPGLPWQIQLDGAIDTSVDAAVYIIDVETPASTIRALRGAGRIVLCYFSAGTLETFRPDAARFPSGALGSPLPGYPDERWVDVRDETVRSIMRERVAAASTAGCDGIHPSGLAGFLEDTGLDFTRADQVAYDRWLSAASRGAGLPMGLVEGDTALARELVADFDWTVVFGCLDSQCPAAAPFIEAAKAAVLIEVGDASRAADVCPRAKALGLSAIIKNRSLDAFRGGCP